MNIAWVVPGGLDRSGEYRVIPALQWLLRRIANQHRVIAVTLAQEPDPATWSQLGATIINIGRRPRRLRAVQALRKEHRHLPFDLVQAFWCAGAGGTAAAFAALARLPLVVHVAGGELVSLPDIGYGGGRSWRTRFETRRVLHQAAIVTAASQSMIELVQRAGRQAQQVVLGVDREVWPAQPTRPRSSDDVLRLAHVASLNRVKDQHVLIEAARLLAHRGLPFTLDIIGEDTLDGELQRAAHERGLEQVAFHGFRTQRELRPLLQNAHVFVLTSRHEAGPVAVLEAAMCGVPTVGTAVGHVAELAPHAAVAVPVGDAVALADAIMGLSRDERRRIALGRAAQTWALDHDADWTCDRFEALYRRALGENA